MPRFTVTVDDDLNDQLEDASDEHGSKSAAATEWMELGQQLDALDEDLDDLLDRAERVDELETENERLQRKLTETNKRREEHQELVRYVDQERTLREQKARAPLTKRVKWWLTGIPDEERE